jgi:glucose-6-phosphate 1-dehydrogenase
VLLFGVFGLKTLNADNVRDEKLKVLKAFKQFDEETINKWTLKGQYTRGKIED